MAKHVPTRTIPFASGEGTQRIYELENGLYASAMSGPGAHGTNSAPWELYVTDAHDQVVEIDGLTHGGITTYLTEEALDVALDRFAALPA